MLNQLDKQKNVPRVMSLGIRVYGAEVANGVMFAKTVLTSLILNATCATKIAIMTNAKLVTTEYENLLH